MLWCPLEYPIINNDCDYRHCDCDCGDSYFCPYFIPALPFAGDCFQYIHFSSPYVKIPDSINMIVVKTKMKIASSSSILSAPIFSKSFDKSIVWRSSPMRSLHFLFYYLFHFLSEFFFFGFGFFHICFGGSHFDVSLAGKACCTIGVSLF